MMEGTYFVQLEVGSGAAGAPTLKMSLVVEAPTGRITGQGKITQALPPKDNPMISIYDLNGQLFKHPMPPHPMNSVHLTGHYYYILPPPAIGTIVEPVEVNLLVDDLWNGTGTFRYGPHEVAGVRVKKV